MTAAIDLHALHQPLFLCRDWRNLRRVVEGIRQTQYAYLLRSRRRSTTETDRRAYERFNAQVPIRVTPILFDGESVERLDPEQPTIPAVTHDLTLRGIGFTHRQLLFGDYVMLNCDLLHPAGMALLLSLRWANVRNDGLFKSGGRFEGLIATESSTAFDDAHL